MARKRNLTDCYLSSFLFLKSGLYLCFLSNVDFGLEMRAKGGSHTLPPITDGRSLTMIVSDLITVYTSL
jgi:hypothetical protein